MHPFDSVLSAFSMLRPLRAPHASLPRSPVYSASRYAPSAASI